MALRRAWARLKRGHRLGVVFVPERCLGTLGCLQRPSAVDVFAELGDVAEDAHLVAADLHEAAVHGDVELRCHRPA